MVLFPYVTYVVDSYVRSLEYPYEIPPGLEEFMQPTATSDTCREERDMMAPISARARTLYELGDLIRQWNNTHLTANLEAFGAGNLRESAQVTACDIMQSGYTMHSTTRANKNVSDFREAGIPSGVAISYDPTDVDAITNERHVRDHMYRASHHPQTAVWTPRYGFIIHDWGFGSLC